MSAKWIEILSVRPVETSGAKKLMKMVCAMALVCRRVRYLERLVAFQMIMGIMFVHIVVTSVVTIETEILCLGCWANCPKCGTMANEA